MKTKIKDTSESMQNLNLKHIEFYALGITKTEDQAKPE